MSDSQPISTDSYKGVRDFYPEELRRRRYIEFVMSQTVEQFGYEEIDASIIESSELYDAKSGDELAQEQSYRFNDRGERDVMLRPEMTPTTARMLARKEKSLPFPVRWYSIANVFRYEKPQHGRLREHWQLNADIFGIDNNLADLEVITIAHDLLKNFGADEDDFVIKVSSRQLFFQFCGEVLEIDPDTESRLASLIDKKSKMDADSFTTSVSELLPDDGQDKLQTYLSAGDIDTLKEAFPELESATGELKELMDMLVAHDIGNVIFEPSLIRGLAYYSGIVFEIFDTAPENNRSLFGGGRYDHLMDMFGVDPIPAVGFGAGDVTIADFLDAHELWPEFTGSIDLDICLLDADEHADYGYKLARQLQEIGLYVRVNISDAAIGTQLKRADNDEVLFVIVIGDDEIESDKITIKELATGEETSVKKEEITDFFTIDDEE